MPLARHVGRESLPSLRGKKFLHNHQTAFIA